MYKKAHLTASFFLGKGYLEVLLFWTRNVHQPRHPELVGEHAERIPPRSFRQWHADGAASRELLIVRGQFGGVITGERHAHVRARAILHAARRVRSHEGNAVLRFQHGVHDFVVFAWVLRGVEFFEGTHRQFAAKDRLVEFHGRAGVVPETQVRGKG